MLYVGLVDTMFSNPNDDNNANEKEKKQESTVVELLPSSTTRARSRTKSLTSTYAKDISEKQCPLLYALKKRWGKERPLEGKRILLNCHLTTINLLFIDVLQAAGAKVDITATPTLVVKKEALDKLKSAGKQFYPEGNIPEERKNGYYDIVFDCAAGTLDFVKPNIGTIELTKTQEYLYRDVDHLVIDIDASKTKELETSYGTGNAAVRVLLKRIKESIGLMVLSTISEIDIQEKKGTTPYQRPIPSCELINLFVDQFRDIHHWIEGQKIMLFGYGKVGKGIVDSLLLAGATKENITIIDIDKEVTARLTEDGYRAILMDQDDDESIDKIKLELKNTKIVYTATGVENAISEAGFLYTDFMQVTHRFNMGTSDEYGTSFAKEHIVNDKKPANFLLEYPTEPMYLDPILTLFARASLQVLELSKENKQGYRPVDSELDTEILEKWQETHKESKWKHFPGMKRIQTFVTVMTSNQFANKSAISDILANHGLLKEVPNHTHLTCGNSLMVGRVGREKTQ